MSLVVFGIAVLISGDWQRVTMIGGVAYVALCVRRRFPAHWRLAACANNNGLRLCKLSDSAVITSNLKVIEGWLQNQ